LLFTGTIARFCADVEDIDVDDDDTDGIVETDAELELEEELLVIAVVEDLIVLP